MHALGDPSREMWKFGSYSECLNYFVARFGRLIEGAKTPEEFVANLQKTGYYGIDTHTNKPVPSYIKDVAATIRGLIPVISRIDGRRRT